MDTDVSTPYGLLESGWSQGSAPSLSRFLDEGCAMQVPTISLLRAHFMGYGHTHLLSLRHAVITAPIAFRFTQSIPSTVL